MAELLLSDQLSHRKQLCMLGKIGKQLLEGTREQPKQTEVTFERRGHLEDGNGTGWVFRLYGLSISKQAQLIPNKMAEAQ